MTLDEYLDFLEQYWEIFKPPTDHPKPKEYSNIIL